MSENLDPLAEAYALLRHILDSARVRPLAGGIGIEIEEFLARHEQLVTTEADTP